MFLKTKGNILSGSPSKRNDAGSASSKPIARIGASILCADVEIKGSIRAAGALQIDGQIEGDIISGDVTIGSTGQVTGEIKAETLRVKGKAIGSIRARKVELQAGALVEGDIFHATLIIQPDARFEGQVKREENMLKKSTPGS